MHRFDPGAVLFCFLTLCPASVFGDQMLRYAEFGPNRGMREPLHRWLAGEIEQRSPGSARLRAVIAKVGIQSQALAP